MRALLEDMKSGEISTYDVPAPEIQAGGILVRTAFSAISAGTEKATMEAGRKSLLGKAMARPDVVKQVLAYAQSNGIRAAHLKVQARLDTLSTLGYSCSGYVLEAGAGVTEFKPGDRVACGGGGYANHCEVNFVPCNLAVTVPGNVPLEAAALTTIGAIAMQGVRQAEVTVGETVAPGRRSGNSDSARCRLQSDCHRSFERTGCERGSAWRAPWPEHKRYRTRERR
jgi:threonine dehydrogenase-like Zn-dependent dehydrogenase